MNTKKKRLPGKDTPHRYNTHYYYIPKFHRFKMYISGNLHHTFKLMNFISIGGVK